MEAIQMLWLALFVLAGTILVIYLIVQYNASNPPCLCSHAFILPILFLICMCAGFTLYMDLSRETLSEEARSALDAINNLRQ